jgi:DNA polymerase-3 subunit delta
MPNLFFLFGNDEFAITRKLKDFDSDFTDPTSADMNTARLDARTASDNDLNNAVNAMPFLAKRRLVLLANPSAKYNNAASRKKFLAFIEKAPDTTRLAIYESVEPRDAEKHWLVKWAEKNEKLIQTRAYMLPRLKEMTGWIINETKNQGGQIEPRAAEMLKDMVGVDTRQAGMEISKLLAYVNWARQIKVTDVEAVCIVTSQQSVFDFVDALSNGNGKSAQHLLHRLLETEEPFSVWGMIVRQFRYLIQAREILDARGNKDDMARTVQIHPFVAEKAMQQAARYTMESLESIYRKLLKIDEGVKTSQLTLDLAMDTLVVELTV